MQGSRTVEPFIAVIEDTLPVETSRPLTLHTPDPTGKREELDLTIITGYSTRFPIVIHFLSPFLSQVKCHDLPEGVFICTATHPVVMKDSTLNREKNLRGRTEEGTDLQLMSHNRSTITNDTLRNTDKCGL